jgi:transcription antitermination factor NusG
MPDVEIPERNWFALFTASNNDKKIEERLRMKEFETFLPLYTATRRWKNRTTVKVALPLFAGYVFARFARSESARVLDIPMVYSIVGNKFGSIALPDAEIDALRQGLAGAEAEPHPHITVGQRARIKSGPLAHWVGVVSRVDGGVRVVLSVDLIMQSVAVRARIEDLELLEEQSTELKVGVSSGRDGNRELV